METKSAARTLDVFEVFARLKRPLTVTELARELNSPVSSCFQLVRTLERRGYMFSLGPRRGNYPTKRMLHECEAISSQDPLMQIFAPALEAIRTGTGETAVLAHQVDGQAMIVDMRSSQQRVRYTPEFGEFYALHSTAVGKAILGSMPPKKRESYLKKFKLDRFTDTTIVDREALEKELEISRTRGWYVTRGENIPDLCAVATAVEIFGQVFALGLGGPFHRVINEVDHHAQALLAAVREFKAANEH